MSASSSEIENDFSRLERRADILLDRGLGVEDKIDIGDVRGVDATMSLDTGPLVEIGIEYEANFLDDDSTDITKTKAKAKATAPAKTIFDTPLGEVLNNTLSLNVLSYEAFMKKVHEAESMLSNENQNSSVMKYIVGFGLLVREGDNGIYLGIVCIMISIIIYFLDITTQ
tara:strand:+ start:64 stop:573 length:510 start_codon:yes stop_codon:yes gene_type:complete